MNKLDLEETTRRFHNVYEQVAKEYGYKTREDTKELDFNSPNGMTMLKTVETITTPYLEEIERLHNIIKEVREYIESIDKVECRYFDYNKALKQMLISYEDLKKKVEEDGTLEGHFIEINKLKLLEILDKVD